MKKILHLTLKKKWFDQFVLGQKKKEYREEKEYWEVRFIDQKNGKWKEFDEIYFRNGYSQSDPFLRIEWKGIVVEKGKFVIDTGKVLEVRNWEYKK